MTDGQFAALLTVIGTFLTGLLGTVRWAAGRITKAIDDATASQRQAAMAAAAAQLEQAKALLEQSVHFAQLAEKIDTVTNWVHEHTPVEAIHNAPPSLESERLRRVTDVIPSPGPLPSAAAPYHFTTSRKHRP